MSMKRYEKVCEVCGKTFIAKLSRAKFCSEKCRNKFRYERKKNKAEKPEVEKTETPHLLKHLFERYTRTCVICGKKFKALLPHAKYCSLDCIQQAHYERTHKGKLTYNRVCPVCGKRFNTTDAEKIYCTKECRGFGQGLNFKFDKKKRESKFEENARRADECGLSYGKYMAQLRIGKTYEELHALHLAEVNRMEEF